MTTAKAILLKIGENKYKATRVPIPLEHRVVCGKTYGADEAKSLVGSGIAKFRGSGMQQYLDLCQKIIDDGLVTTPEEARTVLKSTGEKVGYRSVFGEAMRFDLSKGLPLLGEKYTTLPLVLGELFWMISGVTNIQPLVQKNNNIWTEWCWERSKKIFGEDKLGASTMEGFAQRIKEDDDYAEKFGSLGRIYQAQWRNWQGADGEVVDQLWDVIERIKTNPNCRRLIVSAWNPAELDQMALPPCHSFFQFWVKDGKLSLALTQRSGDVFLGIPFNIAFYSALTMMVAQICDLEVGELVHFIGDAHLYDNQIDATKEMLSREPIMELPQLIIKDKSIKNIEDFRLEHFELVGYNHHPRISVEVAV